MRRKPALLSKKGFHTSGASERAPGGGFGQTSFAGYDCLGIGATGRHISARGQVVTSRKPIDVRIWG